MAGNIVTVIDDWVKIERLLVSVSDKSGLDEFIPTLIEINPTLSIYSTGGTYKAIAHILGPKRSDAHLIQVSGYTGQPETQGGLVKTLDFRIYLGLLTETYNEAHQADLERTDAKRLDMVICNLYPFEETVAQDDATIEEARANIDIGGPCMIRAAAKNYLRVASVVDPSDYVVLGDLLKKQNGHLGLNTRFDLARKAYAHTADYDAAISTFLASQEPGTLPQLYTTVD